MQYTVYGVVVRVRIATFCRSPLAVAALAVTGAEAENEEQHVLYGFNEQ